MSRRRTRKACKRDKRSAQFEHARRRALIRYGLRLTRRLHDTIVGKIHISGSTLIERQSNRISVHDVKLNGKMYRVVYDSNRKVLVTFLYQDEDEWPIKSSTGMSPQQPSPISSHGCDPT